MEVGARVGASNGEVRVHHRTRAGWWVLLWLLSTGCLVAPRETDVTVELGSEQVEILVQARDVRLATNNLLEGLGLFAPIADLAALRAGLEKRGLTAAWGLELTRLEWRARGRELDVELRGVLSRRDFEACARVACDRESRPQDRSCQGFPVSRCEGGPLVLHKDLQSGPMHQITAPGEWPADARRLTARWAVTEEEKLEAMAPALKVFSSYLKDPAAVRASLQRVDAFNRAFTGVDVPGAARLYEEARAAGDTLTVEGADRERMRLLREFLVSHRAELLSPPPGLLEGLGSGGGPLPPLAPMPELLRLKLQVAYEAAIRGLKEPKGTLNPVGPHLARVCAAPQVQRNAESRGFCDQLMLRGAKGWAVEPGSTPRRKR